LRNYGEMIVGQVVKRILKPSTASWSRKERLKFSTNEADALKYEIIYNQAVKEINKKIKEAIK